MDYNFKSLIGVFTCFFVSFILVFSSGCIASPSNGTHYNSSGVSFDHPSGWTFNPANSVAVVNATKETNITFYATKESLNNFVNKNHLNGSNLKDIKDYWKNRLNMDWNADIIVEKNRTVDSLEAIEITAIKPDETKTIVVFIKNGDLYNLVFNYPRNKNLSDDMEVIINSFKIT